MTLFSFGLLSLLPIFFCFVYLFYAYIVQPIFLSKLRHVPCAHPSARFSSLWINYVRHQFRENSHLFEAHQRLGPLIRLAPNELSVNCVDHGIRTIYAGGYDKHVWYSNLFSNYDGVPVMFSVTASAPHSGRKRMMSNVYAKSFIQSSPTMAAVGKTVVYGRLLPMLQRNAAEAQHVNIRRVLERATMDTVTGYMFGLKGASNFLQNPQEAEWWLQCYQSRKAYTFWPQEMPTLTNLCARLGFHLSPRWVSHANSELEKWTLWRCDAAEDTLTRHEKGMNMLDADQPVVYSQLRSQLQKESRKSTTVPLSVTAPYPIQIASELLDHLSAGHETSAITLTFLFYELSLRPTLQHHLRAELQDLEPRITLTSIVNMFPSPSEKRQQQSDLPSFKSLDSLPLLRSILMETLRLHQAIPGPQPRVTPHTSTGIQLASYTNIPGDVRVSANAYCLHRNAAVFPNPTSWIPKRWALNPAAADREKEQARLKEMHRWFWTFGSGGRMCIGSNLAMLQMKIIIAAIVSCFRLELVAVDGEKMPEGAYDRVWEGSGEESLVDKAPRLEQQDAYTAQPVAKDVKIRMVEW